MDKETKSKYDKEGVGRVKKDINNLQMTPVERVLEILNRIEYEQKYLVDYDGPISEYEVRDRYESLLEVLPKIIGITGQDIQYLSSLIQEKIIDISRYELARINAILNNEEELHERAKLWANASDIPYNDAKKEILMDLKENADRHSKIIADNKKTQDSLGNGEQGDGEQGDGEQGDGGNR